MNKTALIMVTIVAVAALSVAFVKPAQAIPSRTRWINPVYRGSDRYLGNVVAYSRGTNWELSVMIENNLPAPANISTIIVYFDWGMNYTHRFSPPVELAIDEVRVFTVSNMTPSTSEAPEMWSYTYDMYVERVNSTSGPLRVVGTWRWRSYYSQWDYDFAIYSANHLQAELLYDKLYSLLGSSPTLFYYFSNVSQAMVRYFQAYFEFQAGTRAHDLGDFSTANQHYMNADTLLGEMLTIYGEIGSTMENATLDYAQASLILANAALINSYAWMFFGIGWVLIGIGIIIYGAKRPKPSQ